MNIARRLAKGLGLPVKEPDYQHIAELEEENHELDEFIDSDGEPVEPIRSTGSNEFSGATFTDVPPWPNERPRYGVDYLPLQHRGISSVGDFPDDPPRKEKPSYEVPVLDDEYFQKRDELELERRRSELGQWRSASWNAYFGSASMVYVGASYYGSGTGPLFRDEVRECLRSGGHVYDSQDRYSRCVRCRTPVS